MVEQRPEDATEEVSALRPLRCSAEGEGEGARNERAAPSAAAALLLVGARAFRSSERLQRSGKLFTPHKLLTPSRHQNHPPPQDLLASVAPKKANFDLKREIQPKLDKLERRTLRALVDIMQQEERRRLGEEGGVAD